MNTRGDFSTKTFNPFARLLHVPRVLLLTILLSVFFVPVQAALTNFVTRTGDKLYDGSTVLRFVGYDMCDLAQSWRGGIHTPDPWEQEDAIQAIAQGQGKVVRMFIASVKTSSDPLGVKFIDGVNADGTPIVNEDVFRGLDKVLQLANAYGVRVILPLTMVGSEPRGGAGAFAALVTPGDTQAQFFTDPTVIADFEKLLSYIANRTNYYTGVQYKNDKSILCWELGNELVPGTNVDAWVSTMSTYLKSIDSNHLIMDGECNPGGPVNTVTMGYSTIDIVTNHIYYSHAAQEATSWNSSKTHKPIIFGEFGYGVANPNNFNPPLPDLHPMLNQMMTDTSSGALLWNMAYRNKSGGFYWDNSNDTDPYRAYRWPGIAGTGTAFDEASVLSMMYGYSYKILTGNGTPPALPTPNAPEILPIISPSNITWKGSVGAVNYTLFKATSLYGSYTSIASGLLDVPVDPTASYVGFNDTSTFTPDTPYFYKMKCFNAAGLESGESDVVSYTNPTYYIVDNADPGFTESDTTWKLNSSAGYNGSYFQDGTAGADTNRWAKWTPNIAAAGSYDIYMYWVANANRPIAAPLSIAYSGGTDTTPTVNQQINGGQWNYIGTYNLAAGTGNSVQIGCSSSGYTIADAVSFVKHDNPPILLYDNFESGVLDSTWTVSNAWNNIEAATVTHYNGGGVLQMTSSTAELMVYAGDPTWTNYSAEAKMTIINSNPTYPGILFRRQDDNDFYMFRLNPGAGTAELFKRVVGTFTLLQSVSFTSVPGTEYDLKVVLSGSSINCYINGTSVLNKTDTTFGTGNVGFRVLDGTADMGSMIVLPN